MDFNNNNFDNLETSVRKTSVIQERVSLVSTHMYKQYLEYQHANLNTQDMFIKIINNLDATVEYLKQYFSARGISGQNIYYQIDDKRTVIRLNILWHTISFTTRCNDRPQALYIEKSEPLFCGRIMAIKGDYEEIIKKHNEESVSIFLDSEVASLYCPAEKEQNTIIKVRHLGNRNFYVSQTDAPREFLLKVIETICGGGCFHEEGFKRI